MVLRFSACYSLLLVYALVVLVKGLTLLVHPATDQSGRDSIRGSLVGGSPQKNQQGFMEIPERDGG